MSADNYYVVRKHPNGGYAAVMGFASDEQGPRDVDPARDQEFPTIQAAFEWASRQHSEYGVRLHAELHEMPDNASNDLHRPDLRCVRCGDEIQWQPDRGYWAGATTGGECPKAPLTEKDGLLDNSHEAPLMPAITSSGEMPEGDVGAMWDRVLARQDEFATFAAGDILTHLRFAPGFDDETIPLANTGLSLHVHQDDNDVVHILVVK